MATIALAEDHLVVRQGLRFLLEAQPNIQVVGEAGDGIEATQMVEKLQPDLLLLDIMMPGMSGLEVARQVKERAPRTRVLVLSMHSDEAYIGEALRAGVTGYVLKDCTTEELLRAVREVTAGRRYLGATISADAVATYVKKARDQAVAPHETLTAREREVLALVVRDHSSAQIAEQLCISRRTAETHRANIMRKLDLHTHGALIRYALENGILSMDA